MKSLDLDSDKTPYRIKIPSLPKGESVMRGVVCREDRSYPFIAISFSESNANQGTQIGVLQEYIDDYNFWRFQGYQELSLVDKYGCLESIMCENYRHKAELEKALNQLLTTGSCDVDPTDPSAGQYKLEQQV